MVWIESHQELRDHPKVVRMSRLLDVHRTSTIGMLHLLWWWGVDHAENGDITDYDAVDLADACMWEGDPETLVKALRECGPGTKSGFIEEVEGRWVLHDWWSYAGKLVARREADRERKRATRSSESQSAQTSYGRPTDGAEIPSVQNRTQPNRTEPEPSVALERREDVDTLCDLLADLIEDNGSKRPTVTKAWRDECRRMLDIDKRDPVKAENLIRWCQADPFWKANVLSMPTFREKYDQLRLKALEATKAKPAKATPQQRTRENAARVRARLGTG